MQDHDEQADLDAFLTQISLQLRERAEELPKLYNFFRQTSELFGYFTSPFTLDQNGMCNYVLRNYEDIVVMCSNYGNSEYGSKESWVPNFLDKLAITETQAMFYVLGIRDLSKGSSFSLRDRFKFKARLLSSNKFSNVKSSRQKALEQLVAVGIITSAEY